MEKFSVGENMTYDAACSSSAAQEWSLRGVLLKAARLTSWPHNPKFHPPPHPPFALQVVTEGFWVGGLQLLLLAQHSRCTMLLLAQWNHPFPLPTLLWFCR